VSPTGITQKEQLAKQGYVLCHLKFAVYQTISKDKHVCMELSFKLLRPSKESVELG
jgi:hypothetical protein